MARQMNSQTARDLGHRSGAARRAARKLDLLRVTEELPPLTDVESVKARLAIISTWTAAGLLSGTSAHALARLHEIWLKAESEQKADQVKHELEDKIATLEREITMARKAPS